MNSEQIEIFINVMRYGTFLQASKHLDMTPSQVRASMDALEQETGVELYHEPAGGGAADETELEMTFAGQRFFRGALSVVNAMEQALRSVGDCAPPNLIRAAAHPVPGTAYLPGLIAAYRLKHPEIRFQLDIVDNEQIAKEIFEGRYDLGLAHPLPSMDMFMLQSHCAWRDRLCLAAPDTPAYRALPPVLPLSRLKELPLILRRPAGENQSQSSQSSPEALLTTPPSPGEPPLLDLEQNPALLTSSHSEVLIRMAAAGLGAGLVPLSLTRGISGIRVFELEGTESLPQFHTDYYLVYPRAEYRLPHIAEFLDLLPELFL
ncbi:MAG: LysR family transcriptional regulator [Peptococcaceae bacterium]|jgi:DNA-binding transcriptional LysR family regulator|nr:LysR family transcriptional regulator [Peptococcaceae bacterium]